MFRKAVETEYNWAFAYEVPKGGFVLRLSYIGIVPIFDDEAEFAALQQLEEEMRIVAPLDLWTENLFIRLAQPQFHSLWQRS